MEACSCYKPTFFGCYGLYKKALRGAKPLDNGGFAQVGFAIQKRTRFRMRGKRMIKAGKRVAIYTRVSTKDKGQRCVRHKRRSPKDTASSR
jgi:hypothetical protein